MDDKRRNQLGLCSALGKLCGSRQSRGGIEDRSGSFSGGFPGNRKGPPIECRLLCNLEDLYRGTTKKMKITRDVLAPNGKTKTVEEILPINVKPGWKKATRITFPEKGHERRHFVPSDVVFVVDERPHDVYTREGDDLVAVERISLLQALTGYTAKLPTLDGRSLIIPISNVIHPNYEEVVEGEGMPITREGNKKGNLRVRFQIKFPSELSKEQKVAIREVTAPFLKN